MNRSSRVATALVFALSLGSSAFADEAAIRKNISERVPGFPKIDEVTKTSMPGIYELRVLDSQIFYTDENGNYIIQGEFVDTRTGVNITEQRVAKLTAIDFKTLPLKDALVWKQGTGERKLVVFADPNCGYCKKFERDLQSIKDITVYTFLMPILGPDSSEKSKQIWCAKDSTKAWRDWMIKGTPIGESPACDTSVLSRNVALGRKHRISATPALVYEDGGKPQLGAVGVEVIERQLVASKAKGNG
jgi:thiol:disulfide interchange protein DsbC